MITIIVTIPLLLILTAGFPNKLLSVFWGGLGLIIPVIDFHRSRSSLKTVKVTPHDWFIIIGLNVFIWGAILITGGINSVLLVLFWVPLVVFTLEFGFTMGLLNLIPFGIFLLFNLLSKQYLTVSFRIQLAAMLGLSIVLLLAYRAEAKAEAHYHQKIDRLLHRDELTGLYNRRFLKNIIRQAIKEHTPFCLIMMDINYFKYFNDYWGHSRGDTLLIQVGRLIRETISANEKVIRYSGDEFFIFSPKTPEDATLRERIGQIIDSIQRKVEETHFPGAEYFPGQKLSLAYGAALYPDEASTYEGLIEAADRDLYRRKQAR